MRDTGSRWPTARRLLFLAGWLLTSLAVALAYAWVARPDLRYWPGAITHGNPARRAVALTFDDGPHPLWTPLLADTLERHGARGTFFLVGMEAERYPELVARLIRGDHEVASHSLTHPYPNLTRLSTPQIEQEVRGSTRLLRQLTRAPVRYFRPPGGAADNRVIAAARVEHLRLAWWSRNIADWQSPPPAAVEARLRKALRPGAILLLHERENTAAGLERYLAGSGAGEYTCVTLSSLLQP